MALGLTEEHQALAGAVRELGAAALPARRRQGRRGRRGQRRRRTTARRSAPAWPGRDCSACTYQKNTAARVRPARTRRRAGGAWPRARPRRASCRPRWQAPALMASAAPGKLLDRPRQTGHVRARSRSPAGPPPQGPARRPDRRRLGWPVLGGSTADLLILPVQTDEGELWAAADPAAFDISELDSLDLTRPVARVTAAGVSLPPDRILTGIDRTVVTGLAATRIRRRGVRHRRLVACTPPPSTRRSGRSSGGRSASSRGSSTGARGC